MNESDTISSIATALGEGGIGIIRLSGREAVEIAAKIFHTSRGTQLHDCESHKLYHGMVIEPDNNRVIDEALMVIMRRPYSYTCEDVVEIQCHGGLVAQRTILEMTLKQGARLAEPGEYTKRAFLNGRLDLSQAEAVIDVIRSKSEQSLTMAVSQLQGSLSEKITPLRIQLLQMVAAYEASIDFPEDVDTVSSQQAMLILDPIFNQLSELVKNAYTGKILRDGLETVISGRPNVGKSSLLNALVRYKRAIVTEIPGTTRDVIEEYITIGGIPIKIVDTAGIRETSDPVEKIGVEMSQQYLEKAELVLAMLDSSCEIDQQDKTVLKVSTEKSAIILLNKSDLPMQLSVEQIQKLVPGKKVIPISVATGQGLDELEQAIVDMVYANTVSNSSQCIVSNIRHKNSLERALQYVQEAREAVKNEIPADLIVIDIRSAWEQLGEIIGETVSEDIIDQIFSQFCIGK